MFRFLSIDGPARAALTLTAPVAMGYVPLGMVFGFLFVQAGGAWWLALSSSLFVYAGASQYMMIPLLAANTPIGTIALATLIVNSRHMFYGLSLLKKLPEHAIARWYLVFALTDETYSVVTTMPDGNRNLMVRIAAINQCWWVFGTLAGALIGAQAKIGLRGLDFALVALFCVLAVEQWRVRKSAVPLWSAVIAYGLIYPFSAQNALVLSIAASLLTAIATLKWAPRFNHD